MPPDTIAPLRKPLDERLEEVLKELRGLVADHFSGNTARDSELFDAIWMLDPPAWLLGTSEDRLGYLKTDAQAWVHDLIAQRLAARNNPVTTAYSATAA